MARRPALLVGALLAALGAAAIAQQSATTATHPVLHEQLPDPAADRGSPSPMIGATAGGNPAAFNAGDKVLPKPDMDRGLAKEPVLGDPKSFGADRQTSLSPDEKTGADPTLHYVSVFNPDVLPFKRMSAFDKIADDETLHVGATALTELPVGGTTDPKTRDRFWGDVVVRLTPGRDVALPSVAPDMRILSYETKPHLALHFSKDGADNFYVRSDESSANGEYRLVFLADADAGYFAPSLPPHPYYVRDITAHAPPELRAQLDAVPERLRREAAVTLAKLKIDKDMTLGVAFNKLVGNFRSFQPGTIANASGDVYRDLCDSRTGVCRHRSFAFVITANALGIPARFVENEAHAFVEVWLPERTWQRIDLGGASPRLEVTGGNDKTLHRPRADDPFTKPPEYGRNYTNLEGDIRGLTKRQLDDKHRGLDQAPPSGAVGDGGTGSAGQASTDHISPDQSLPAVPPDPAKKTPRLQVTFASDTAYRGASLEVRGAVYVDGKPLADHAVHVFLAQPGGSHASAIMLGLATTGADGTFRVQLPVPGAVDLKLYDLLLTSDEDATYNAAISE